MPLTVNRNSCRDIQPNDTQQNNIGPWNQIQTLHSPFEG
jgi:hypothetical protein